MIIDAHEEEKLLDMQALEPEHGLGHISQTLLLIDNIIYNIPCSYFRKYRGGQSPDSKTAHYHRSTVAQNEFPKARKVPPSDAEDCHSCVGEYA